MTAPVVSLTRMPDASGELVAQKRRHRYCLTGIFDEAVALNYALTGIPIYLSAEALFRQDVRPSTQGSDLWYFDVEYGPVPMFAGTWSFGFDTTGGTIHWGYSLECVESYRRNDAGATVVGDRKHIAIGEREGGVVEGTERIIPVTKLSYSYRQPKGVVTEAYVRYMTALTGIVNSSPWHGYAGGELLFLGMRGNSTLGADAESSLTFEMLASPNVLNQSYGVPGFDQVTGIDKEGHEFLDVVYREADNPNIRKRIEYVRIHRMYEKLPFSSYLGF